MFPDQGWNPCPLHWHADSYPLYHQGSSKILSPEWTCMPQACALLAVHHKCHFSLLMFSSECGHHPDLDTQIPASPGQRVTISYQANVDVHREISGSEQNLDKGLSLWYLTSLPWPLRDEDIRDIRDADLIPGLGRFSGEGNNNPPQYACLGYPTDRGAWRAIVYGVAKELAMT